MQQIKEKQNQKMQEIDDRKLSKELQTEFRKRTVRAVKKAIKD